MNYFYTIPFSGQYTRLRVVQRLIHQAKFTFQKAFITTIKMEGAVKWNLCMKNYLDKKGGPGFLRAYGNSLFVESHYMC